MPVLFSFVLLFLSLSKMFTKKLVLETEILRRRRVQRFTCSPTMNGKLRTRRRLKRRRPLSSRVDPQLFPTCIFTPVLIFGTCGTGEARGQGQFHWLSLGFRSVSVCALPLLRILNMLNGLVIPASPRAYSISRCSAREFRCSNFVWVSLYFKNFLPVRQLKRKMFIVRITILAIYPSFTLNFRS